METTTIKALGTTANNEPLNEMTIERREVQPHDVEFEVLYCGICHSDLHQIHNDFGHTAYPIVPGHEIVGKVTKSGSQVTNFKVGELVAVGCVVDSCKHCQHCEEGHEQYCEEFPTFSFNSPDKYLEGKMTYGGFAKTYVCEDKYVLHMPDFKHLANGTIGLAAAAPLLCAGITVYSPLRYWNAGPGKKVGVLGIGGLGHLAIKIAKAMGAEVTVFTTSPAKVEDAERLGADHAVLSKNEEEMQAYRGTQDFIIDTVSAKHDVNTYLGLLKIEGTLVLVGLPPEPLEVGAFNVVMGRRSFAGSNIGGIAETQEMLYFCAEHDITAEVEVISPSQVNEAFERLEKGDVKYRFVIDMDTL
ncbi:MAG: zinc-binding dehydrogenase [Pseudozobellia sp.]|nr:zinc-binding dehydrogenase [Pseudozobellia sp.]MBG48771.1 zinc-binding dehydrogenase [Pseudozobellia sp.]|tara:strand:+ start:170 stop:1243 length:1074 start_codon:yes stop_codon:yes gene_type:complete